MAVDPNSTTTATTAAVSASSSAATSAVTTAATSASSRPLTSPPPSSRPISPLPQPHPHPLHNAAHHYPSQALYTAQPLPIRGPNPLSNSQLTKPHDPAQSILYPVASSGRGFIPKGARPLSADQMVTVANPGAYPPSPLVYSHSVRAMGSPHLEYLNHSLHMARPPNLQYPHLGSAGGPVSGPIMGVPVLAQPKTATRSAVSDSNGYKDTRERSRDDTFTIIRDRKVRITEDASLYTLCRSWLRNSTYEENLQQQKDVIKALPKPLPASMVASYMSNKKEDEENEDEQEEDGKSVEQLSPKDLLKRHIKRAKKVRARLREERLQRIARYRSRLRLLLPPQVEQFRNDTAAGN